LTLNLREIHWLASFPKSGNTWVRFLWQAYVTGNGDINANLRLSFADNLQSGYQQAAPFELAAMGREHRALLRPVVLMNLISQIALRPLVVKTHCAAFRVNSMDLIPAELSKSYTYLIRDPRDVAVSYARHLGKTVDEAIEFMGDERHTLDGHAPQFVLGWSNNVKSWERMDGIIVRYEDLKADPAYCFSAILKNWGVDPDPERVARAVELTEWDRMKKQEQEEGFIEAGEGQFFAGSDWRKVLTDKQLEKIDRDHGETMRKYGYL